MKIPCIRGLDEFKKKGCPGKMFDGKEGCPAWVKLKFPDGNGNMEDVEHCIDILSTRIRYDANAVLSGIQMAVESFRNNMTTEEGPRPDPALFELLSIVRKRIGQ